ncbi:MAG: tRNA pseudouridine(55) synthase TruB [Salinibacterium sp.]|nr:tRNA pseudouridine(55) synthase TruB [Salinibacterium sp.]
MAKAPTNPTSGILLVDKPQGITSHDAVSRTRKAIGTRRVGHAGTLDPMATGLLVLGVNGATRLLTYVVGLDKEYLATIRLGAATTTDDAEGEFGERSDVSAITDAAIADGVAALTGPILQRPSSVSAIKVDGRRAYTLVREGEDVVLAERPVTIVEFEVIEIRHVGTDWLDVDVRVVCTSGTYIRALARDLGDSLGVGGHLTVLRRTRIGPFTVAGASELDGDLAARMLAPADVAAQLFERVDLSHELAADLSHGKRIGLPATGPDTLAAIAPDGRLVGLVKNVGGRAHVLVNFPPEVSA